VSNTSMSADGARDAASRKIDYIARYTKCNHHAISVRRYLKHIANTRQTDKRMCIALWQKLKRRPCLSVLLQKLWVIGWV